MTTQPAQTTEITFSADDLPKLAALDEATAADNMRRLWRQETAVREAEISLAHAKALAKDAKSALEEELAKLRGMVAEFSNPNQLA